MRTPLFRLVFTPLLAPAPSTARRKSQPRLYTTPSFCPAVAYGGRAAVLSTVGRGSRSAARAQLERTPSARSASVRPPRAHELLSPASPVEPMMSLAGETPPPPRPAAYRDVVGGDAVTMMPGMLRPREYPSPPPSRPARGHPRASLKNSQLSTYLRLL